MQLERADEHVQRLQLEVMRMQEEDLEQERLIAEQLRRITGLTSERDDLTQQLASLVLLRKRLESDVAGKKADLTALRQKLDSRDLQLSNALSNNTQPSKATSAICRPACGPRRTRPAHCNSVSRQPARNWKKRRRKPAAWMTATRSWSVSTMV